jgi:adenylate cyclase
MATDERGTIAALDAARGVFRTQIESNGGRVIDTAGDSVLAVFDTAAGAVRAALAVQENLGPALRFRIGVHLGDVMEKPDGTIYGDGVNIAARLQSLAEPGGILISDAVQGAVRGKIAASFADQGEQSVKNIAAPVRAYRVSAGVGATPIGDIDLSVPSKPSIAVLPFTNMGGGADQESFVDGVTEDIITELSRFRSLFVIARNSTFSYKGRPTDVRAVSRELGVRYVLEGSVRRADRRVRVTAQLIDALSGAHIWAERYDRVLEDIFAVQEELTRNIVAAIAPEIDAAELKRAARRRPDSLSAYEIAVRASATVWDSYEKQDRSRLDQGIADARAALAIDPNSVVALVTLARAQWLQVFFRTVPDLRQTWQEAINALTRAIELDRSDHSPHTWKGATLPLAATFGADVRWEEALADVRRGHELNPNDSFALQALGWLTTVAGNAPRGIEYLLQVLRANPRDPFAYNIHHILAFAHFTARDYEKGVQWAVLAASEAPSLAVIHHHLALCYVGAGEIAKAKTAFDNFRRLAPELAKARLEGVTILRRPEDRPRYTTFLRIAAGLEDPGVAERLR